MELGVDAIYLSNHGSVLLSCPLLSCHARHCLPGFRFDGSLPYYGTAVRMGRLIRLMADKQR